MAIKIVITDKRLFSNQVFGADCALRYWPELLTTGVPVKEQRNCGPSSDMVFYYVLNEHGEKENDTAFFADTEMKNCMRIIIDEQKPSEC